MIPNKLEKTGLVIFQIEIYIFKLIYLPLYMGGKTLKLRHVCETLKVFMLIKCYNYLSDKFGSEYTNGLVSG